MKTIDPTDIYHHTSSNALGVKGFITPEQLCSTRSLEKKKSKPNKRKSGILKKLQLSIVKQSVKKMKNFVQNSSKQSKQTLAAIRI